MVHDLVHMRRRGVVDTFLLVIHNLLKRRRCSRRKMMVSHLLQRRGKCRGMMVCHRFQGRGRWRRMVGHLLQRGRCRRRMMMVGDRFQGRGRRRRMIDNLLLADVSDLLGALLLERLLLHGLVAVLAPDTSMIIDL